MGHEFAWRARNGAQELPGIDDAAALNHAVQRRLHEHTGRCYDGLGPDAQGSDMSDWTPAERAGQERQTELAEITDNHADHMREAATSARALVDPHDLDLLAEEDLDLYT